MERDTSVLLTGRAYGHRATLELAGDALTWRARRGSLEVVAENIATTTTDVTDVRYLERRFSFGGGVLAVLGGVWMSSESFLAGLVVVAIGALLVGYRALRPRRHLALVVGGRWLVLRVDEASAGPAREVARCIEKRLLTGELLEKPIALP